MSHRILLARWATAAFLASCMLGAPSTAAAATVTVFEQPARVTIRLGAADNAAALFDALDVAVKRIPPDCPSEDVCTPAIDRKNVSTGAVQFSCDRTATGTTCYLAGPYALTLAVTLPADAAAITAAALNVLGNPFQSGDGLVAISCDDGDGSCQVRATAATEYWLDGSNLIFAQYQYGSYGRSVLRPFLVNDAAQAFYDIFDVPEEVTTAQGTKTLRAGALGITCYRAIAPWFVYRYRCNFDLPVPNGTQLFPFDVTSVLPADASAALYAALALPGPVKEFVTADGLTTPTRCIPSSVRRTSATVASGGRHCRDASPGAGRALPRTTGLSPREAPSRKAKAIGWRSPGKPIGSCPERDSSATSMSWRACTRPTAGAYRSPAARMIESTRTISSVNRCGSSQDGKCAECSNQRNRFIGATMESRYSAARADGVLQSWRPCSAPQFAETPRVGHTLIIEEAEDEHGGTGTQSARGAGGVSAL